MASLLRAALEGQLGSVEDDSRELIEIKGPLSEVFSQALNEVYARPEASTAETANEAPEVASPGATESDAAAGSGDGRGSAQDRAPETSKALLDSSGQRGGQSQGLESQANDALALAQLINNVELASADTTPGAAATTVYGVSATDVKPEHIVEVSQDLAELGQHGTGPDNYVVVMDATQPSVNGSDSSNPEPRVVELAQV
jgi:hypothetical protein